MYRISCPWCGEREQTEFRAAGEAHIKRPVNSAALSDAEWSDYVFMRKNPKGVHFERWVHVHGCRRWFHIARNTATDEILMIYSAREAAPPLTGISPVTPCGEGHGSGFALVEPEHPSDQTAGAMVSAFDETASTENSHLAAPAGPPEPAPATANEGGLR